MGEPGSGPDVDWWLYEDLQRPLIRLDAAVGYDRDEVDLRLVTYEEMRPGAYRSSAASRTWTPTTSSRRCASRPSPASAARPSPRPRTRTLALLCVKAYNDWMVDEWCG